jgi:hypothetical protein
VSISLVVCTHVVVVVVVVGGGVGLERENASFAIGVQGGGLVSNDVIKELPSDG